MPSVECGPVRIHYQSFGSESDPALVFIAGLGSQSINYPDELCEAFVAHGLRVIRFDNRDCGLTVGPADGDSYTFSDMGGDVVGLLDALGIERAHVWGSSMGGMIAQTLAIERPSRVATLTSVQSTTGEPGVGSPDDGFLDALLASLRPTETRDEAIDAGVALAELLINNPDVFDRDAQRIRYGEFFDRAHRPRDQARQVQAVMAATDRADGLRALRVPTLVIHGSRDRLINPSGGRRTAELIPGARYVEIEGMGHDLSRAFWPRYVEVTADFIASQVA
jgi:pimeloyl-ACP methyl ester carboxylesterase